MHYDFVTGWHVLVDWAKPLAALGGLVIVRSAWKVWMSSGLSPNVVADAPMSSTDRARATTYPAPYPNGKMKSE